MSGIELNELIAKVTANSGLLSNQWSLNDSTPPRGNQLKSELDKEPWGRFFFSKNFSFCDFQKKVNFSNFIQFDY